MAIEVEVLLDVCGFVVDICNDLVICLFIRVSKNGCSFELGSMINFIFGLYIATYARGFL